MNLSIDNLNIVGHADIAINGLAVIAGENGAGKSTIGKTLYATIKAVAGVSRGRSSHRINRLRECAEPIFERLYRMRFALTADDNRVNDLPESLTQFIADLSALSSRDQAEKYFAPMRKAIDDPNARQAADSDIDSLITFLFDTDDLKADISSSLDTMLRREFSGNVGSIVENTSKVSFSTQGGNSHLSYTITSGRTRIDNVGGSSFPRDATYVESPLYLHLIDVLSKVSAAGLVDDGIDRSLLLPAHVAEIVEKVESLRYIYDLDRASSSPIAEKLRRLSGGEFYYDSDRHLVMFRQGDDKIVPLNVASGVKSLGLLQILLDSRIIGPDRLLIWDEPENHLHPLWQIRLAQLLVELAQEGLPILVSTHSPYFIQGIRHFAVKLKAERFVDYYLTEMEGHTSVTRCVNDDLNRVFIKLAAPLHEIMDMD